MTKTEKMFPAGPTSQDVDRVLGIADQFLEDWAEDAVQAGTPDAEYEDRQAEWEEMRPLLVAAPKMRDFIAMIARMNWDGEEIEGQAVPFEMTDFDAHEAVSSLIATARHLCEDMAKEAAEDWDALLIEEQQHYATRGQE